jgi:hypothetical protein
MFQAMAGGAQIINQHNGLYANLPGQSISIDDPRQIRRMDAVVDDRASHAETTRSDFFFSQVRGGAAGKFPNDEIELGEFLAGKAFLKDEFQLAVLFCKERQIAFGAADVACENHLASRAKPYIKPF